MNNSKVKTEKQNRMVHRMKEAKTLVFYVIPFQCCFNSLNTKKIWFLFLFYPMHKWYNGIENIYVRVSNNESSKCFCSLAFLQW